MASQRKLQVEIDRVLKKVQEGSEVFEMIWKKVQESEPPQKEKHEGDLKKEIKKLQRFRDQIKTWIGSSEIKEKKALVDARKQIERDMERFKACERETKTKAFSKEGLAQLAAKQDPKERARNEAREWLNSSVDELNTQIDSFEAEMEGINVKKGKAKPAKLQQLESFVSRHREHIKCLEQLIRLVDREDVTPEETEELKDMVSDYIERNGEDETLFEMEVDDIYYTVIDKLHGMEDTTASVSHLSNAGEGDHHSSGSAGPSSALGDSSSSATTTTSTSSKKEKADKRSNKNEAASKNDNESGSSQPATTRASKKAAQQQQQSPTQTQTQTESASSRQQQQQQQQQQQRGQTVGKGTKDEGTGGGGGAGASGSGAIQNVPYSRRLVAGGSGAAGGAVGTGGSASSGPGSYQQQASASETSNQARLGAAAGGSNKKANGTAGGQAQQQSRWPTSGSTASTAPDANDSAHQHLGENAENAHFNRGQPMPPQPNSHRQQTHGSGSEGTIHHMHPEMGEGVLGGVEDADTKQKSLSRDLPSGADVSGRDRADVGGVPAHNVFPPDHPKHHQHHQEQQHRQHQKQQSDTFRKEMMMALRLVDSAVKNLPQSRDVQLTNGFRLPPDPVQVPESFPRDAIPVSENALLYEKLGTDTLFYIFYYMQGTYYQYLAARELKRQSWRYHKKYATWFLRHDEPKLISDEYEQGSYVFFDNRFFRDDFANSWRQKVKSEFRFEYAFLENELPPAGQ